MLLILLIGWSCIKRGREEQSVNTRVVSDYLSILRGMDRYLVYE